MKILLKGYYGFGNLGDDILLTVTYHLIKNIYPEAEFYIFSNFTENLTEFDKEKGYNRYIFNIIGNDVKLIDWTYKGHFDLLVDGGGGIYFDHQNKGFLFKVINYFSRNIMGCKGAWYVEKLLRKTFNKPSNLSYKTRVGIGIGMGEFNSGAPTFFSKLSELNTYDFLWVRDKFSIRQLQKFRFKRNVVLSTDLAFHSEIWQNWNSEEKINDHKTVGVILMDVKDNQDYLFSMISQVVEKIRKEGYIVKFFSFDENYDKNYIRKFQSEDILVWRPNKISSTEYLKEIQSCGTVISARAHGAILGACLGAIPICISSSRKLIEVGKMFKSTAIILPVNVKEDKLIEAVINISKDFNSLKSNLKKEVEENKSVLKKGVDKLKDHLNG